MLLRLSPGRLRPGRAVRRPATLTVATGVLLVLWLAAGNPLNLRGPGTGSRGGVLFSVPLQAKAVAFTFDDGPSANLTPAVLEILHRYSARATFFPIGRELERYPDLARRVLAEGHELGCHTYNHVYLKSRGEARLKTELDLCEKAYPEVVGIRPSLLRFPGLSYNDALVAAATKRGYSVISCSLDAYDWRIKDAKQLAKRVISLVRPGDIILMHDGDWLDRSRQIEALNLIFRALDAQGYEFVTVSELIRRGLGEALEQEGGE